MGADSAIWQAFNGASRWPAGNQHYFNLKIKKRRRIYEDPSASVYQKLNKNAFIVNNDFQTASKYITGRNNDNPFQRLCLER